MEVPSTRATQCHRVKPARSKTIFRPHPRRPKPTQPTADRAVERGIGDRVVSAGIRTPTETGRDLSKSQMDPPAQALPNVPPLFVSLPPIRDALVTETSLVQDETVEDCRPHLAGSARPHRTIFDCSPHGLPRLERDDHIHFLKRTLQNARYMAYDASRPWFLYWSLTGLCLLGEDVKPYRERVIQTLSAAQNPDGGFGGGHGQISHSAPTYAAVLSLAMVGGTESLETIDRRALQVFRKSRVNRLLTADLDGDGLARLNSQTGGSKCVLEARKMSGAYCSMVIISLLALPLELPPTAPARAKGRTTFLDGLPAYLSRCQTYEGGISGNTESEAHGAYAFCALACLCILGPPHEMIPKYLDLPLLMSWLSSRQYAPEGGFSGRTNKLVDGCYSHWVGGCWPLIHAALSGPQSSMSSTDLKDKMFYSREGLIRYILCCCQQETGGLRDKPSMRPDAYHSCYTLAGLSFAQFPNYYRDAVAIETASSLDAALHWASGSGSHGAEDAPEEVYDAEDHVTPLHPIFVIPWSAVEETIRFFSQKQEF